MTAPRAHSLKLWALAACAALVLLRQFQLAWISDDAYITFRVIDNALSGHGLRWNIDERVQVYTHPLWLLLHLPLQALLGNIERVNLLLSLGCVAASGWLLLAAAGQWWQRVFLVLLPLGVFGAFTQQLINGLEAPLSLLLLLLFLREFMKDSPALPLALLWAALAMLNRLDNVVLLLPALAYLGVRHFPRGLRGWGACALATFPLWGWLCFSLLYYGFIFPNTRYAKLNTDLSALALARGGLVHLINYARFDAPGASFLLLSLLALWRAPQKLRLIAAGIALHLAYVVAVGGDYMTGRFFTAPLAFAMWLGCHALRPDMLPRLAPLALAVAAVVLSAQRTEPNFAHGMLNSRPYTLGWQQRPFVRDMLAHKTSFAQAVELESEPPLEATVFLIKAAGMQAYAASAAARFIDYYALTDALLARLPSSGAHSVAGHFIRAIPGGYLEARATGNTAAMHPELAAYYEKLRSVISAPIFSPQRLTNLWALQTGQGASHLRAYLAQAEEAPGRPESCRPFGREVLNLPKDYAKPLLKPADCLWP